MSLKLKVTQGNISGKEFTISDGLTLGRSKGDIIIHDPKASSNHARIEYDSAQVPYLIDLGSRNGSRINGIKVNKIKLLPPVVFQIGRTTFEVIGEHPTQELAAITPVDETTLISTQFSNPPAGDTNTVIGIENSGNEPILPSLKPDTITSFPDPVPSTSEDEQNLTLSSLDNNEEDPELSESDLNDPSRILVQIETLKTENMTWSEHLKHIALKLSQLEPEEKAMAPLLHPLKLQFFRGIQAETEWVLGYGPRKIGATSIDLPLNEENAPDTCFEILPSPGGCTFQTNHPDLVKINGQAISSKQIDDGDIVSINDTYIRIGIIDATY